MRYFSLARYALIEALSVFGIGSGARVLMPEYICRDLLASVRAVGAIPVYYPINEHLQPAEGADAWPQADVVLAVDYFGFEQPIEPFREYCKKWGVRLIEDNAHGFLSRDEAGHWLGLRGDAGLFSLRKTFLMVNGAALVVQDGNVAAKLGTQLASCADATSGGLWMRRFLRRLTGSRRPELALAEALRRVRQWREGYAIPVPAQNAEAHVPGAKAPSDDFYRTMEKKSFGAEAERRRRLYAELVPLVKEVGCQLVFPSLPVGTVPYGLPVFCKDILPVSVIARRFGLDCFRWPDLPDSVVLNAPQHYRNLHVVNFL